MKWNVRVVAALLLVAAVVGGLVLAGYGRPEPRSYPVGGVLLVGGRPLAATEVVLMPDDRSLDPLTSGVGVTDDEGRVTVRNGYGADGLPAGLYRVSVASRGGPTEARPPSPTVPADYLSQETTPARVEVAAPAADFRIDIPPSNSKAPAAR